MKTEKLRPHPSICSYMDSEVNCNCSALSAVRQTVEHLSIGGRKGFFNYDKNQRRFFIASCILRHAQNVHIYRYVMGSVPRKYPKLKNPFNFNPKTHEVTTEK